MCVFSKDIVFVEIAGRSTRVVTTQGEYNSENGIDFWDSKLAAPSFFRVHKSYIVNVHYATDYSRTTIVLCGEYEIPVAYRRQAEFRHFFSTISGDDDLNESGFCTFTRYGTVYCFSVL